jgi:Big-like domain-containing protein/beta-propeller repeat-containing protein/all-beta uncharacterized protein/S-layer family protein
MKAPMRDYSGFSAWFVIIAMAMFAVAPEVRFACATITNPECGKIDQHTGPSSFKPPDPDQTKTSVAESFGKLPMSFEPNVGQVDSCVRFLSRGRGYTIFLTSRGAVLALKGGSAKEDFSVRHTKASKPNVPESVVRMKFLGARPEPGIAAEEMLPGKVNYLIGKDRSHWHRNIATYGRVKYSEVYPGISLIYYGNQQELEYDFVVASDADPAAIKMTFDGMKGARVDANGDLILKTAGGELRQHKPIAHQEGTNGRNEVAASYKITRGRTVSFVLGNYDRSKPLIIDPVLSYSTYIGGNNGAGAYTVAVDQAGNAYIAGNTTSTNFPVTSNAYRTTNTNSNEVYVTKLNPEGTSALFSSYISGGTVYGIAVDNAENAYITGDGVFVTKLNTNPSQCTAVPGVNCSEVLVYSITVGGANYDSGQAIAVDSAGNAYVTGRTLSGDFPTTTNALQRNYQGGDGDAFVFKVSPTGSITYSTYLGGNQIHLTNTGNDAGTGIAVDSSGNAYVTGWTNSATFPTTPGAVQPSCVNCSSFNNSAEAIYDAFVSKLNADGGALVYSTYLGGSLQDSSRDIAIDDAGNAYVTGRAYSFDFPTTPFAAGSGSGGVVKSVSGGIKWGATGPGVATAIGDTVNALAIDPINPSTIYAGVFSYNGPSGILKSTDGGGHWRRVNSGLTATNVRALTIAPTLPLTIYAGFDTAGVYKSTNGGENWTQVNTGLFDLSIASLAADPANPLTVYCGGTQSGVSKSADGGAHWSYTGGPGSNTLSLIIDPANPSTVFAGRTNSVDKTTDGGATWLYIGQGISNPLGTVVRSVALDPTTPTKIYAGTDKGVFKTTDGAATPWVISNTGLGSTDVRALAIDPMNPATIYAATANGVFKSNDSGNTWKAFNRGMIGSLAVSLAIDPASTATVYAGTIGSSNIFVAKLNSTGTALDYATYLSFGTVSGIAVDAARNAVIVGTSPGSFPITDDAIQPGHVGDDAFLAELSADGSSLLYASYLGGNGSDTASDVAIQSSGTAYIVGWTFSTNFPTTEGAFRKTNPGINAQGFASKIALPVTANFDNYSTNINDMLSVPAPGVIGNDVDAGGSQMTAVLFSGTSNGSLSLSPDGSFTYIPNANFAGFDSFRYRAQSSTGAMSNIAEVSVDVVDVSSPCAESLTPTSQTIGGSGGASSVMVTGPPGCSWRVVNNAQSFITVNSTGGSGTGSVGYSVAANPSISSRTGTITIAGHLFTIAQAASGSSCAYSASPTTQSFPGGNGAGSINLTAGAGCGWIASSNANWITFSSGESGSGNGTVTYSLSPNPSNTTRRSGTISIADQTLTVLQGAAFLDVPANYQFYSLIGKISARGVTIGCGGGNYCPESPVTREQMAAFIIRALGMPDPPAPSQQRFADVPPSNSFYAFIEEMAARGITLGCGTNAQGQPIYCPSGPVTREQMAAFLIRALGDSNPPIPASQRFNDVPASNIFYNFIDRMAVLQITLGCSSSPPLYCPSDNVTRGQMAAFLVRAFGL